MLLPSDERGGQQKLLKRGTTRLPRYQPSISRVASYLGIISSDGGEHVILSAYVL